MPAVDQRRLNILSLSCRFKKTGRHFDRGEENFVLPPEFLELIIQRVSQTITDVKDEALRHKCIDKVDNFLAGRRTDQHRMMDVSAQQKTSSLPATDNFFLTTGSTVPPRVPG